MPLLTAVCLATQALGADVNSAVASQSDEGMEPPAREGAQRAAVRTHGSTLHAAEQACERSDGSTSPAQYPARSRLCQWRARSSAAASGKSSATRPSPS